MSYYDSPLSERFAARRRKRQVGCAVAIVLGLLLVVGGWFALRSAYGATEKTRTVLVNEKERVCEGSGGSCKYLIYTDKGTFAIQDSHWVGLFWRTNSSDVYGTVKENTRYRITTIGWRFGFTSTYPNIKSLEEVPS